MPPFLSTIFYILSYNLIAILFFGAAIYCKRQGKSGSRFWYLAGLLCQGYSVFGTILGMVKQPEQWRTAQNYISIAAFAVMAAAVLLVLLKADKKEKK